MVRTTCPHVDDYQHESIVDCCLGAHPKVWYKFKRFECLSLLNLYYYQHELIRLDNRIFGTPDVPKDFTALDREEWLELRSMIKEYQTAIQLFKQTSQMKRPPMDERQRTIEILTRKLRDTQYDRGHDAMGMLDLSPDALHTSQGSLRGFIEKKVVERILDHGPVDHLLSPYPIGRTPATVESQNRETTRAREPQRRVERTTQRTTRRMRDEDRTLHEKNYTFHGQPFLTLLLGANIDRVIRFVVGVVAAASLLVPLIVLSKIWERDNTIMATCLFVFVIRFYGVNDWQTVDDRSHGSSSDIRRGLGGICRADHICTFLSRRPHNVELGPRLRHGSGMAESSGSSTSTALMSLILGM